MKILTLTAAAIVLLPLGSVRAAGPLSQQDQTFVQKAAIGGMAEVEEGQIALTNAAAADVKQFGQRMVDEHKLNNQELMALARQKGLALPTAPDAKHTQQASALKKQSGAAFDRTYISGQVAGHREMEALLQAHVQNGSDPDLKAFAQKTLPVVQEHLRMAQQLQTKS
jgi:putative membrane protein